MEQSNNTKLLRHEKYLTLPNTLAVIPTYNEGKNIERTVGQVLAELPEVDVLIVDDSDDTLTLEVLNNIQAPHVKLVHRESRGGLNTALNLASSYAQKLGYSWLLILEADLFIPKGCLNRFVTRHETANYDVVNCVNYPIPTKSTLSFRYASYVKWHVWCTIRKSKSLMPAKVILIRGSCLDQVFPIPDFFLDGSYWINGIGLEKGLKVFTSWDEKVFFVPPQNSRDIRRENMRSKFCSDEIGETFQKIQPLLVTSTGEFALVFLKELIAHPKFAAAIPWLFLMYSELLVLPEYAQSNKWIIGASTKKLSL